MSFGWEGGPCLVGGKKQLLFSCLKSQVITPALPTPPTPCLQVEDQPSVARHYLRGQFAADLLGCLPLDWLLLAACCGPEPVGVGGACLWWLPLVRLVQLVRLYRLRNFFRWVLVVVVGVGWVWVREGWDRGLGGQQWVGGGQGWLSW